VATLEQAVRDQPDPHRFARRAAEDARVVGVQVALLVEPLPEPGRAAAHHDVGLLVLPGRQGAAVHGALRQRGAPVIGEVLPVVEFDGDAQVVVRGQGVLGEVDRQFVHAPRPAQLGAGAQCDASVTPQDADVAVRVAADGGASVGRAARPENLARAEVPEVVPGLGGRHRLIESFGLGQHQPGHTRVAGEVAEELLHVGAARPFDGEYRYAARHLSVALRRRPEASARVGPLTRKITRHPQPAPFARDERVRGARAAEHRATFADPAPELERGSDPDVERAGEEHAAVRQDRHRLAGLEVDAGVEPGWLRGRQPVECVPGAEPGRQRCEPRFERGAELAVTGDRRHRAGQAAAGGAPGQPCGDGQFVG
jgi:hypothetical protein